MLNSKGLGDSRFRWLFSPRLGLAVAIVAALVIVMARSWPLGPDYYYTYFSATQAWLRGATRLYDHGFHNFYNAPWTLVLLVPLVWLPLPWGGAVLNVLSLVALAFAAHPFRKEGQISVLFVVLAVANLHTFDLLIRGQVDALGLAGVAIGWIAFRREQPWLMSTGFWLMSLKPNNLLLAGVLFLIAMRRWPLLDWIRALSLPVVSLGFSFALFGLDWPVRYVKNFSIPCEPCYASEWIVTLWRAAGALHIPAMLVVFLCALALLAFAYAVWKVGLTWTTLSLALATNLAVTPYGLGYHYVLLIPAFLFVASRSRPLAVVAYALTWTPLLRLRWGFAVTWVDFGYLLVLLMGVWWVSWREIVES